MKKVMCMLFLFLFCEVSMVYAQDVHIVGAMKNVMRKGELFATIDLDSLSNKTHLYGMGPVEYLTGELSIQQYKRYFG